MLTMALKKKWFDMILSGEKKEEYREIKDYWARRFLCAKEEVEWSVWCEMLDDMKAPYKRHNTTKDMMAYFGVQFNEYEAIHFINGYGATKPCFDIEIKRSTIGRGKPEWGAEGGKFYFVFQLGDILTVRV